MQWLPTFILFAVLPVVLSYVPAVPTNSTNEASAAALDIADAKIFLQWYPQGSYIDSMVYQFLGDASQGITQGVFVHFPEDARNEEITETPWVAWVSCDSNSTDASLEVDIFTLAREKGAKGAILYSLYSTGCILSPDYANSRISDPSFDIFATTPGRTVTTSHLIEYQFGQISQGIDTYNSSFLNNLAPAVDTAINKGIVNDPSFIFASLTSYTVNFNASGGAYDTMSTSDGSASATGTINSTSGDSSTTSEETDGYSRISFMSYLISGCVSTVLLLHSFVFITL